MRARAFWSVARSLLNFCILLVFLPRAVSDELIFAVRQPRGPHWYENFGHQVTDVNKKAYGSFGRLCKLDLENGRLTLLVDDPDGGVRDPQVHYDGQRILFSYRRGGSPFYHLYEINADGTGLTQLTDGPFDDIEPSYLPGWRHRLLLQPMQLICALLVRAGGDPLPLRWRREEHPSFVVEHRTGQHAVGSA